MSPKPIDPISSSQKASAESTDIIIPRNADSAQVLAEAKSRLESAKEERSKSRRKLLFWGLLAGLIIFLVGAGVIAYDQYQARQKQATIDDARHKINQTLDSLDVVDKLSEDQKKAVLNKVGAKLLAAQTVGIAPNPQVSADKGLLKFITGPNPTAESISRAIEQVINAKLKLIKDKGYYEGYVFYYWYGNPLVVWPSNYDIPGRGSQEAYEVGKKKAFDMANSDRQALQSGQVQPSTVVEKLDQSREFSMYEDPNGSSPITPSLLVPVSGGNNSLMVVQDTIYRLGKVGYSDIKTVNYVSIHDASKTPVEAGYYFVRLDKFLKGDAVINDYESALKRNQTQGL
jgi:hypothetical protein